ncbi:hypothetical protein HYC85_030035 [Camellia sinensis]|uniref:Uncharacterized protein n=1 Tax=Camellia sinensis TaxID=4442 RepID=A0A7J7G3F4_CAMSI|nr:hypothetical protein HYC85_030035 [Camellia sinensis]
MPIVLSLIIGGGRYCLLLEMDYEYYRRMDYVSESRLRASPPDFETLLCFASICELGSVFSSRRRERSRRPSLSGSGLLFVVVDHYFRLETSFRFLEPSVVRLESCNPNPRPSCIEMRDWWHEDRGLHSLELVQ